MVGCRTSKTTPPMAWPSKTSEQAHTTTYRKSALYGERSKRFLGCVGQLLFGIANYLSEMVINIIFCKLTAFLESFRSRPFVGLWLPYFMQNYFEQKTRYQLISKNIMLRNLRISNLEKSKMCMNVWNFGNWNFETSKFWNCGIWKFWNIAT